MPLSNSYAAAGTFAASGECRLQWHRLEFCIDADLLPDIGEYRVSPRCIAGGVDDEFVLNSGGKVDFNRGPAAMCTADGHFRS